MMKFKIMMGGVIERGAVCDKTCMQPLPLITIKTATAAAKPKG
jgi:hypothetical protein